MNGDKEDSFKLVFYLGYLRTIDMRGKLYKDVKATLILLSIVGVMVGIGLFARYGTEEQKIIFIQILAVAFCLVVVIAAWLMIRTLID